jgi:hypothetical protein
MSATNLTIQADTARYQAMSPNQLWLEVIGPLCEPKASYREEQDRLKLLWTHRKTFFDAMFGPQVSPKSPEYWIWFQAFHENLMIAYDRYYMDVERRGEARFGLDIEERSLHTLAETKVFKFEKINGPDVALLRKLPQAIQKLKHHLSDIEAQEKDDVKTYTEYPGKLAQYKQKLVQKKLDQEFSGRKKVRFADEVAEAVSNIEITNLPPELIPSATQDLLARTELVERKNYLEAFSQFLENNPPEILDFPGVYFKSHASHADVPAALPDFSHVQRFQKYSPCQRACINFFYGSYYEDIAGNTRVLSFPKRWEEFLRIITTLLTTVEQRKAFIAHPAVVAFLSRVIMSQDPDLLAICGTLNSETVEILLESLEDKPEACTLLSKFLSSGILEQPEIIGLETLPEHAAEARSPDSEGEAAAAEESIQPATHQHLALMDQPAVQGVLLHSLAVNVFLDQNPTVLESLYSQTEGTLKSYMSPQVAQLLASEKPVFGRGEGATIPGYLTIILQDFVMQPSKNDLMKRLELVILMNQLITTYYAQPNSEKCKELCIQIANITLPLLWNYKPEAEHDPESPPVATCTGLRMGLQMAMASAIPGLTALPLGRNENPHGHAESMRDAGLKKARNARNATLLFAVVGLLICGGLAVVGLGILDFGVKALLVGAVCASIAFVEAAHHSSNIEPRRKQAEKEYPVAQSAFALRKVIQPTRGQGGPAPDIDHDA